MPAEAIIAPSTPLDADSTVVPAQQPQGFLYSNLRGPLFT
jgi:hypothetical protein